MKPKRYELEFDMWRMLGCGFRPERVKVTATTREYAEKRMRDVVYKQGGYNGRYVAFYPNGTVKDGRVVKSPVGDTVDMQAHSVITSREFHYGFGEKYYFKR